MAKRQAYLALVIPLLTIAAGGCSSMTAPAQTPSSEHFPEHFDGKRFFNPWGGNADKSLWDVLKWKISTTPRPWPEGEITNTASANLITSKHMGSVHITWIGHATVYIQSGGKHGSRNLITDPFFSTRASPVGFAGPARNRKPGIEIAGIPALDTVLISHNHYDHLDLPSLKALKVRFDPTFIVPLGNAKLLREEGIQKIVELDWWQSHEGVQLVPAQHWSARGIADRNEALWGGYVIEISQSEASIKSTKLFFAGDTGYGPHFKMIREKCGPMDLSLLPIGAYEPRWFMKDQHMNPADAAQAHLDLESRQSMAIHFETIRMTDEGYDEPRRELAAVLESRSISREDFIAPQVGGTLVVHDRSK